ncbi:hypothetical protein, partial [Pseudoflavonifractor capillosus]|uniref:hypothetical protein n=1 Tax=Pseudoflavonifractor capillosus TaxID=106588 RepID=UPI00195D2AB6
LLHAQNAAEVPHTGFVFAVESKKGCATKLTFCDTSFLEHPNTIDANISTFENECLNVVRE